LFPEANRVVSYVGRISRYKNVKLSLQQAVEAYRMIPNCLNKWVRNLGKVVSLARRQPFTALERLVLVCVRGCVHPTAILRLE
jgi:hypothetical protein